MCSEAHAPPRAGEIGREDLGGRGTAALGFWGQAAKDGPKVTGAFLPRHPSQVAASQGRPRESPHTVRVGCTPARQAHPRLQGVGQGCKAGPPTGTRRAFPASRAPGPAPAGPASLPLRAVSTPGRPSWRGARGGGGSGGAREEGVTHRGKSPGCQAQLRSHSCVTWAGQATSLVLSCHF